ncbi:hypothetical protein MBM_06921 [Drepanopeziza brunnea f. sp. 'multigermtubi' MB_m1]|uniref:Uncharacterized protein n=1 Tax=Marssonina brunnea f. sp. multigermtubi (strain MB_m1) TaxID=1072389 RepID=K1WBL2_MARBU|nr:uncharacterized protein MBM_06921 [Drepanopeziza brunnea f. sp. 'multigermtubi' MB_m1]EKD14710.1 hypothetical protein MBM_06921 [Drepanopeziza brunnea f. sp. 'multigermtubi' MB_m1]
MRCAIPSFTEVSSPELQDLLTRIRERIFLPAHVNKSQRKLIFSPKHAKSLEVEPAIANIAGEDFRLRHLELTRDVPSRRTAVLNALRLMKEKRDWDNLPNLLGGLKNAGCQHGPQVRLAVVGKAGKAGRQDTVLECLRRAEFTGLTLQHLEMAIQVLYWMAQKAVAADWDAQETKKALAWAEMVRDMMEEPKHKVMPKRDIPEYFGTSKDQPEVPGILLQLAAVRATQTGKDEGGKVERYAKELLGAPKGFQEVGKGVGKEAGKDTTQKVHTSHPTFWLSTHAMVLHGIKVALPLLDAESKVGAGLKAKYEELEPLVLAVRDQLVAEQETKGKPSHSVEVYEKLLGPGSKALRSGSSEETTSNV